jgi:hypothetical protein
MGWMLDGLDDTGRKRALDALIATVTAHAGSDGIIFASGAWLIRPVRATEGTRAVPAARQSDNSHDGRGVHAEQVSASQVAHVGWPGGG